MTDKVNPSEYRPASAFKTAGAISYAGGSKGFIIDSTTTTELSLQDTEIDDTALNAFQAQTSTSSLTVTITPGEAFIFGSWVATDESRTVTLDSNSSSQNVYLGWDKSESDTIIIGTDSAFNNTTTDTDKRLSLYNFTTDSNGVTNTTDRRDIGKQASYKALTIARELGVPVYSDNAQAPQEAGSIIVNDGTSGQTAGVYSYINSSYKKVGNTTEEIQDIVANLITGDTDVNVNYDDSNDTLTVSLPNNSITVAGNTIELGGNSSINHSDLATSPSGAHHTKTSTAAELDDVSPDSVINAHHEEYTDNKARTAIGASTPFVNSDLKNNTIQVAGNKIELGGNSSINHSDLATSPSDAHHSKYTNEDAQQAIANNISSPITANNDNVLGFNSSAVDVTNLTSNTSNSGYLLETDADGNLSWVDPTSAGSDAPVDDVFGNTGSITKSDVGLTNSDIQNIITGSVDAENLTGYAGNAGQVLEVQDSNGNISWGSGYTDSDAQNAVNTFSESYNDLVDIPQTFTPEEHGNSAHSTDFAVDGDTQPPENHGNSAHSSTFAVDGDTQPPENHGNTAHSTDFAVDGDTQPPKEHGNSAHSSTFAVENDLFSGSHNDLTNVSQNDHHNLIQFSDNNTSVRTQPTTVNFDTNISATDNGDGTITVSNTYGNSDARNAVTDNVNVSNLKSTTSNAGYLLEKDGDGNLGWVDPTTAGSDAPVDDVFGNTGSITKSDVGLTNSDIRNIVTGNVNAANLTGDTGTAGQVLEVQDSNGTISWGSGYTDSDAQDAVNTFSGSHDSLYNVDGDDHHSKTSSASELTDVSPDSDEDAHHIRYSNEEAQDAVGGSVQPPLNYDDDLGEITLDQSGISHDNLLSSSISSDDHHSKTSSASELSDVSADSNSDAHHSKTSSASELSDVSADSNSDAHHSKYTDSDAQDAVGGSVQPPLNYDDDLGEITLDQSGISHDNLLSSSISSDDHHSKTSSASELSDVSADSNSDAHHSKYTDNDAQDAVGGIVTGALDYSQSPNELSIDAGNISHSQLEGGSSGNPHAGSASDNHGDSAHSVDYLKDDEYKPVVDVNNEIANEGSIVGLDTAVQDLQDTRVKLENSRAERHIIKDVNIAANGGVGLITIPFSQSFPTAPTVVGSFSGLSPSNGDLPNIILNIVPTSDGDGFQGCHVQFENQSSEPQTVDIHVLAVGTINAGTNEFTETHNPDSDIYESQ